MIERLARTICKLRGVPPDDHHSDFDTQWQAVAREAKGLLISMLEPTEHMTRAGAKMGGCDIDQARAIYRAMVDAAIDRNI
ncbi:hypothetical protein SAMN05518849_13617 [Sphingobium sp. AP50]|uniref:hypothetical protein n=1 Tax=Sphingobium sp. AP50 TaxID=1884369 RepID=UPI0008B6FEC1|nr:hypothetical protein [Sphingobium sp. AP50]SEK05368.1 hypothetical protein SAMN05518849_13617 [Sphingobium sp. AP50]